jgi:hypothetical protein
MALSSGKPFEAASGAGAGRLGLRLTDRVRRQSGCVGADAGNSPRNARTLAGQSAHWNLTVRRLAAKLLEHAAREAVFRCQQGDFYPRDLLLSDPIRSIYESLLHDREPLVWRHAAVARGILSSIQPSLREEIDVALDPDLSPTEWRRAGVSLVATLVSEPESSLRALKQLLDGPVSGTDPGLGGDAVDGPAARDRGRARRRRSLA